jgi:polysaccharide export outer membrane protein
MIKQVRHLLLLAAMLFSAAAGAQGNQDYTLGAGDAIRVQVFQNPDLTIEARVSENGAINYPLIGAVQLGGLSIAAAEKKIADALRTGGFVQKPQVNIVLVLVRGNQVSVLGQVNRPGRFPLETFNTKVSDMLAAAGGATQVGDDVAIVTGIRDGKPFRKEIDIATLFLGGSRADDIIVAGGDSIYVHRMPIYYIYGEAQRPGSFRVERGMTIRQALANGGGPTIRGSQYRVRLHRKNAAGVTEMIKVEENLDAPILPNDVLWVNESIF